MNKTELIQAVTTKTGLAKKDAEKAVTAVFEAITETLKEGKQTALIGFGTFAVSKRSARTGRNPKTKEVIQIAARNAPSFKAGKGLKDAVNS